MKSFIIPCPENFNVRHIFECGQCFRFNAVGINEYEGVGLDTYIRISQDAENLKIYGPDEETFDRVFRAYFDMDFDYSKFSTVFSDDYVLKKAYEHSYGIRILKQNKWEALCSFIISQNNNIPRIKGIIERMSEKYGKEIYKDKEKTFYSFPTPEALYNAGQDEIFAMKTGFRARFIYEAAKTMCENPAFLDEVSALSTREAADKLITLKGVGEKVAACTLLFGFSRYDAFPVDVWMKRVLEKYYSDGKYGHLTGEYAGIAQQYLFFYERSLSGK